MVAGATGHSHHPPRGLRASSGRSRVSARPEAADMWGAFGNAGPSVVAIVLAVVVLIVWINIASTVKRFHDRDKSGVWFLIVFVPYIGAIWQLVECGFLPGSPGNNDYGPPPGSGGSSVYEDMADEIAAYSAPQQRPTTVAQAKPWPRRSRQCRSGNLRRHASAAAASPDHSSGPGSGHGSFAASAYQCRIAGMASTAST